MHASIAVHSFKVRLLTPFVSFLGPNRKQRREPLTPFLSAPHVVYGEPMTLLIGAKLPVLGFRRWWEKGASLIPSMFAPLVFYC